MKLIHAVILSGILHNFIRAAYACSPPEGWSYQEPVERARKADMVIYGTVRQSPRHGPKKDHDGLYSAVFEVHCILKGNVLPQFINVSGFGYAGGLCTHSVAYLNKTYIAFIRRDATIWGNDTRFYADEVNVQSATILIKHKASRVVLKKIVEAVGKNASLPLGTSGNSKNVCSKFPPEPLIHPTSNTTAATNLGCHHKSHRHKKRRHKKCRVVTTQLSDEGTKPTRLTTTVQREANVAFLLHNRTNAGSCSTKVQSVCWRFLLIFHGLVFVVLKWRQT